MNFDLLRIKAINFFQKQHFLVAKDLFSLLYREQAKEEFLSFISLCTFAEEKPEIVMELFNLYFTKAEEDQDKNLKEIIKIIENEELDSRETLDSQDAILYEDFMQIVKDSKDFKQVFQNIMHSTRILIDDKDDLLNFIKLLLKNGYKELALSYLENSVHLFEGDLKFEQFIKKIGQNENLA